MVRRPRFAGQGRCRSGLSSNPAWPEIAGTSLLLMTGSCLRSHWGCAEATHGARHRSAGKCAVRDFAVQFVTNPGPLSHTPRTYRHRHHHVPTTRAMVAPAERACETMGDGETIMRKSVFLGLGLALSLASAVAAQQPSDSAHARHERGGWEGRGGRGGPMGMLF